MEKRQISGLSLNKRSITSLSASMASQLYGGSTGYESCAIECGGGGGTNTGSQTCITDCNPGTSHTCGHSTAYC